MMSMYQSEDTTQGDIEGIDADGEFISTSGLEMSSPEIEKTETEFHLANETIDTSPRSAQSGASSSEIFASPAAAGKGQNVRPGTKSISRVSSAKGTVSRTSALYSSIPLPVKSSGPIKIPMLLKNAKSSSRTSSIAPRSTTVANRHTLEIQFINKNKRYLQMRKELVERQRPILDLYQNLLQIKKRLEELGKNVKLEEIKLVPFEEQNKKPPSTSALGGGEEISMEIVNGMKSSIEEIPKTLMDICKNLLSRRALIVELLESVTKSEVDVSQVSEKIDSLKCEGQQLQQSLDAVIEEHESKISQLVANWQKLLNDKQSCNADSKIEELETKLKEEEKLREESVTVIHDLHRKMDERKLSYDRSIAELNGVLHTLKEQIKKLETDLDNERKTSVDFKSRNNTNAQNLKTLRVRITELESEKKDMESSNSDMQKKIRLLQDQLKHKESQWTKEKDEMTKSLKHQENLLQKLTADKNQFETRLETISSAKNATEGILQEKISSLTEQLSSLQEKLLQTQAEKNEALEKCAGFESYVARMKTEFEESMSKVSYSIEWGKAVKEVRFSEAENYMQDVAKDVRIRELEDRIKLLEKERVTFEKNLEKSEKPIVIPTQVEHELQDQRKKVEAYKMMLEEAENKLNQKSTEIEHLHAEIRQLKVRQERLEEENESCSVQEMQKMLEEGRRKLNELMNRSIENDDKVQEYITTIEKQKIHLNEMENLLRYRENMGDVLKATRNELLMEKESLSRYSREMRAALVEVTNQSALKDDLIKSLNEKIRARDIEIRDLERKILELEDTVQITNEKRYKLQETVGNLEKELQRAQRKINHLANEKDKHCTRWSFLDSVYEVVEDKPNKKVSHYCNSLMENHKESELDLEECQHCIGDEPNVKTISLHHNKQNKQNTLPTHLGCSSDKLSYQNVSVTDKNSSIHTHCHHKANSRSLISLSLQKVDFLKTKLNFLSSVNTSLYESPLESQQETLIQSQISSTQTSHFDQEPNRNLSKILQLTAHRYEYLQNQAQESYDDLTNLVKLAVTQKGGLKK